jgi:hypothetical protein
MRHQLVQEHIAKITNQEETNHVLMKPKIESQKRRDSFPLSDTSRVQVVQARGDKMCRIVVDTPAGHSAGRIKIVMGFERIEQAPVAPKPPTRAAAVRPVSSSVPLSMPPVREAPVLEEAVDGIKQDAVSRTAVKMKSPQQSMPSVANESLQKPVIIAAPVMEANLKPDTNVKEPHKQALTVSQKPFDSKPKAIQHQRVSIKPTPGTTLPHAEALKSTIPQQAVERKPAATHTQRVSIKPTGETIKPAAIEESRNLATQAAPSQQKTSIHAQPKAPPTKSKVPTSHAKSKVPTSHRGKAKMPPSQRGATLSNVPASQRVTAKRSNLVPEQPRTTAHSKEYSLDGNDNASPLDKVEFRGAKQRSHDNKQKLHHGRRKYAVEELQKMYEENKLKGPPPSEDANKTIPKNDVSNKKKKEQKKFLKVFRS